ncbi:hypothetical protein COS81_00765 [candidate division WWE3 bacterium CG06_land_8_20_14_3_00_42_16]|uniref:Metallopeptidase family protein n=1 Tax=candidate division WWE3 bacterium CG06_land_8_20_14_3_00_42_16 TaxID=1975083 RepID=A0A2M7APC8_UNCKA|nr:MAG: hypothetical protein COS81_00765 [candidate division WWE3 bacterium CG06_land_8_20_14_3_00_42_16]
MIFVIFRSRSGKRIFYFPLLVLYTPLFFGYNEIMKPFDFEALVNQALTELPPEFKRQLDNVAVVIEEWPTEEDLQSIKAKPGTLLFGLYRGIPKIARGANYSSLPDKIAIFSGPILSSSPNAISAKQKIKEVILHEIGHHFGLREDEIRKAERRRKSGGG